MAIEVPVRETRVDIVRGIAILVILINHLSQVAEFGGLRGGMIPTPTRFGYSTAAELFVILSGYMVGLVYLRRARPGRTVLRRAGKLWLYNLGLLALVWPLLAVMASEEAVFWRLDPFAAAPGEALFEFTTLQTAPRLLDILMLYILLMLVTPLAIAVERRSWIALIAVSVGLYLAAQALTVYRLETVPGATKDGVLDRLSWQMLFFVPMALGTRRAHERLFAWLEGRWGVLLGLAGVFVAAAVVRQWQADGTFPEVAWLTPRFGLTVLRVGHAVLTLMLYASALTLAGRWIGRQPFRAIGMVGRHSLDCFAAGVLLTYGLGTAWLHLMGNRPGYYGIVAIAIALTVTLAYRLEARRRHRTSTLRASNPLPAR